jgi:hypothetical protein
VVTAQEMTVKQAAFRAIPELGLKRGRRVGTLEMGHVNGVNEVGTTEMTKPADLPVTKAIYLHYLQLKKK